MPLKATEKEQVTSGVRRSKGKIWGRGFIYNGLCRKESVGQGKQTKGLVILNDFKRISCV